MKHFVFELKLSWRGLWGNILGVIPCVFMFLSTAPSIHLQWMGFELSLWCGIITKIGTCIYITPCLYFKRLDKRFMERYDFQFSWLCFHYRKFIGERDDYETSIKEEIIKDLYQEQKEK